MKYIRYAIIAVLVYLLVFSVRAYLTPVVSLISGSNDSAPELPDLSNVIALFRTALLPYIAMIILMLVGWLFPGKKMITYGVLMAGIPLLCYLAISSFNNLGYTAEQSFLAILQGYGGSKFGWLSFYLIAMIALPFAEGIKSEKAVESDAEPSAL